MVLCVWLFSESKVHPIGSLPNTAPFTAPSQLSILLWDLFEIPWGIFSSPLTMARRGTHAVMGSWSCSAAQGSRLEQSIH